MSDSSDPVEPKAPDPWLTPAHLLLLLFVNLIWGVNLLTTKLGVSEMPPVLFSSLRVAVMTLVCLPWLRWFPGQMRTLFVVALCTGAGGFGLLALGLRLSADVSAVAVFTQLMVPFSVLLSIVMLGEVIHWRRKLGIALAFVGVITIGFDARAFSYLPGLLLVVLQSLSAALGMIYIKRLKGIAPMQLQVWIGLMALPILLGLSLLLEQGQVAALSSASGIAWGAVLFAALGSSLAGQTGFFYLLRHYPVSRVAPMTVTSTLFGMIAGVLWHHDRLTAQMIIGGAMTLAGVLIIELRTRERVLANPSEPTAR